MASSQKDCLGTCINIGGNVPQMQLHHPIPSSYFSSNQPEEQKPRWQASETSELWTINRFEPGLSHRTSFRLGDDRADQLKTEPTAEARTPEKEWRCESL